MQLILTGPVARTPANLAFHCPCRSPNWYSVSGRAVTEQGSRCEL